MLLLPIILQTAKLTAFLKAYSDPGRIGIQRNLSAVFALFADTKR